MGLIPTSEKPVTTPTAAVKSGIDILSTADGGIEARVEIYFATISGLNFKSPSEVKRWDNQFCEYHQH